jgi:hypothetical protein
MQKKTIPPQKGSIGHDLCSKEILTLFIGQ